MVTRRRDVVRQFAVVRQNQQALRVEVEATYGVESSERLRHEFRHERSAFRVGERREVAARLVEQDVNFISLFEERVNQTPAHLDVVARRVGLRPQLAHHFAVYGHLARLDQLLGVSARRNPRGGDQLLQALFHSTPMNSLQAERLAHGPTKIFTLVERLARIPLVCGFTWITVRDGEHRQRLQVCA